MRTLMVDKSNEKVKYAAKICFPKRVQPSRLKCLYPRHDTTKAVVDSTRGGGTYSLWVEGPGFEHPGEMVLESTYI